MREAPARVAPPEGVAAPPTSRLGHRDYWRLIWSFVATLPIATALAMLILLLAPDETLHRDPGASLATIAAAGVVLGAATSWAIFALIYTLWTRTAFRRHRGEELRAIVRASTPQSRRTRVVMRLLLMDEVSLPLSGALFGLAGVIALIVMPELRASLVGVISAFVIIASSWVLMIVGFAMTYLRAWARDDGLEIPGEEPESFDDFIYVSVQVATTFASSDAQTRTTALRKWVTLNSIIAFVFNTVIVALFLSVATSAAG